MTDAEAMAIALAEAGLAHEHDDVPVGAVVLVDGPRSRRHNERRAAQDPTAHAEILALRDAATVLGTWRLDDATLVVTLEPCPMCAGAAVLARLARLVFGAPDPKAGACGLPLQPVRRPSAQPRDRGRPRRRRRAGGCAAAGLLRRAARRPRLT